MSTPSSSSTPIFTALATSTRQLHSLLRCIAFTPTATIQITPSGLRLTTEEVHAIQATTILDKTLFSSYLFSPSTPSPSIPPFQINITALLETLAIFTSDSNPSTSRSHHHTSTGGGITSSYAAAFHTPALGLTGTCRITYLTPGAPLSITIEESGVKTTCEMNTYSLPNHYSASDDEIPLDRNSLVLKIIMPASSLHDAVSELASTSSETLVVSASSIHAPYFALEGHGGPFGDSSVDFAADPAGTSTSTAVSAANESGIRRKQPAVTETFTVAALRGDHGRVRQRYRFESVKRAGRAMAAATKVSVRMDRQGVLSLQFMIGGEDVVVGDGKGDEKVKFVEYRFVPLVETPSDEEGTSSEQGENREDEYVDADEDAAGHDN